MSFEGKVALITGAGNGLGKSHALMFAGLGARVVVNDYGTTVQGAGADKSPAEAVVDEITGKGGEAVANTDSVESGARLVETAMDAFGRLDIVVNNAGFLRDISFHKMRETDWFDIINVHLNGAFKVNRAAWPYMREQNFGRIVNTASAAGIYGNFGQVNYSSAKLALHGMTQALAIEGQKRNIFVNTIAPAAASRLTDTVISREQTAALRPELVSPLVGYLCSEESSQTGGLFEAGAGWFGKLRWERSRGVTLKGEIKVEDIAANIDRITDFSNAMHPQNIAEAFAPFGEAMGAAVSER
ncbi:MULTISPECIES: SDR family oxidoreductase [Hyphococcus]|uniref:Serine/threonine protein kinase n=1 Tax=Hyphococcus luteus TaxID=2058213 RepID=A0A2S7K198_9PROT|nr:SDR family oxidoreductase [Marinicaulis flavus]PQA86282.1 serine/threonine protein kinase [Marinicaulis flavus]